MLKANGTGKETTLSVKIETDKFILIQCIELQKYLRSLQFCVYLRRIKFGQVLCQYIWLKQKASERKQLCRFTQKHHRLHCIFFQLLVQTFPQIDQVIALFFLVLNLQFTKIETDKFILVQCIELQNCLRSPQFCVCLRKIKFWQALWHFLYR